MNHMERHLELHEIIAMAMRGDRHPHFEECEFCFDQYQEALDLEQFESSMSKESQASDERFPSPIQYRLAAQDSDASVTEAHVRRTWYIEDNTGILRVMEDEERSIIYGHLIIAPERYGHIIVRFSGIDSDFVPDAAGIFDIGSSDIDIERMDVSIKEV